MSDASKTNLYARAGITDLEEFYRTKFVSDEVLDARYFAPLNRFDMRFARTMWVYDNVRAGSSVLDVGCGAGMLALLKRKGVVLTGVDLSGECALAARRNGYDATCQAELTKLPFANESFDYVVSLDVLGHAAFEEKDAVLAEIKRVLRGDGVTMHGIECTDRAAQKDYAEMSAEELRRFIEVDGHVGLEEEEEHAARFGRFFTHVAWEPRYALCLSSEEFLKQADRYGLPFEQDFLDYLRGLSFKERRAFDMAMGYVFGKISDLHIRLAKSGIYVFLKASDAPLGSFYNEHRDRRALIEPAHRNTRAAVETDDANDKGDNTDEDKQNDTNNIDAPQRICLDRNAGATFDDGWYEPNILPPVARWMRERGRIRFVAPSLSRVRLDLTTHMPELGSQRPIRLELLLNGAALCAFSLFRYGWLELDITLPEPLRVQEGAQDVSCELEIRADRTWQPRPDDPENRDDRELSIAVCNIEIE
ncbi:MAG TPA: methyltransferase domain-containing protein [Pyrinomonadaceae bacterium]|jgi:SAM-dependent methyltransferase